MKFFSFAVILVVAALQIHTNSAADTDTDTATCPPGSQYGLVDPCEIRCDRLPPMDCPEIEPQWGCQCDKGLIPQTGTSGKELVCVQPEDCKAVCGDNAYYDSLGSPCQPICGWPDLPLTCKGIPGPRCICNRGYIMDEQQEYKCVKPNECLSNAIQEP